MLCHQSNQLDLNNQLFPNQVFEFESAGQVNPPSLNRTRQSMNLTSS